MEILQPPTDPIGALCYLPAARTGGALRPPAVRGGPLVITIGSSTAITIDTRRTASTPCRTAGGDRPTPESVSDGSHTGRHLPQRGDRLQHRPGRRPAQRRAPRIRLRISSDG
jgi:hypothetical protein